MNILDRLKLIEEIDKDDMLRLLVGFSSQSQEAIDIGRKAALPHLNPRMIENIIISGMGGSAIGGDLLRCSLIEKIKIPIFVNRNYTIPGFISEKSLVFICSYSGNTEETLSAFSRAKEKNATIIALSSNGKLEEIAKSEKFTFIKIPGGLPPRCALGYSFFPLLVALFRLKLVDFPFIELEETLSVLKTIEKENNPQVKTADNLAKEIALKLFKKLVIIYTWADYYEVAAYRFRCQLAENSKHLSSHHTIPEMNHNEIMGWSHPKSLLKNIEVVFLIDKTQHERVSKRIEILSPIIEKKAHDVVKIYTKGNNLLAKIFSLIYIGDFISFYLAILNKVNPTPVDTISYLKKKLAE
jgi:glucose/mannose-6-phosphate isomerase